MAKITGFKSMADIRAEKARRLTEARELCDLNRTEAARLNGWKYNTYKSHESGQREFDVEDAAKYATAFGVSINHLLCLDLLKNENGEHTHDSAGGIETEVTTFTVPVYGRAAGGLWLEGDDMHQVEEPDAIPAVAGYPAASQYARLVVGNSVNNRIADGEYAIFVRYSAFNGGLRIGMLVDCQRSRAGFYEHSVKVFQGDCLMTDSHDLATQVAIPLNSDESDTLVEILGIAVGAYRPLLN